MSSPEAEVVCGDLVALVQMTAVNDTEENFATCAGYAREAARQGCKMVFFPECFSFLGARPGEAQGVAESLDGPVLRRYRDLAQSESIWLSLGGFQESCDGEEQRIYNTHIIVDDHGEIRKSYRKIHLFDAPFTGLVESKQAMPGSEVVSCDSPIGKLGVTICYDMRFPELYQKLTFAHGAQILLMPSAFAMKTGAAHWDTLLRCRAIENQCYVIAAAQVGMHNEDGNKRQSWGHALAIDPWGSTIASMGESKTGIALFRIDLGLVSSTRRQMPMQEHRRYDIYGENPKL